MARRVQHTSKTQEKDIRTAIEAIHDRAPIEYTTGEPLPEEVLTEEKTYSEEPVAHVPTQETPPPTHHVAPIPHKKKRHWVRWIILLSICAIIIAGCAYAYSLYRIVDSSISENSEHSTIEQIARIIDKNIEKLNGEADDRINILLLGMGGENHPGGTLTDTVMIASIQPSTHAVTFVSIPRDFVVPIPPENLRTAEYLKINSVLFHGDMDMEYRIIKLVTGLDIHYHILLDFDGFVDVIDAVGGIEVNVVRSFQGYYGTNQMSTACPSKNIRTLDDGPYCIVSFEAGQQHMNGEAALMYSRIRKVPSTSSQTEAGDFARAERQQIVIQAFKDKVLNLGTLLNPSATSNLLSAVGKHVSTNMEIWEMLRVGELAKEVQTSGITNIVLDTDPTTGVLVDGRSSETGAYYIQPKAGLTVYDDIQTLIANSFISTEAETETPSTESSPTSSSSTPSVVIQNASGITGLAARAERAITHELIEDIAIGNALDRTQATTRLYLLSKDVPEALRTHLEQTLGVTAEFASLPTSTTVRSTHDINGSIVDLEQLSSSTDILILLGQNSRNLAQ